MGRVSLLGSGNQGLIESAAKFIAPAGITDATQIKAANYIATNLIANNLWPKSVAFYPFIGGTATAHKFNLINPVDSDGAYRIAFSGGITHSSNGMAGNGTTGYGDTKINNLTVFPTGDDITIMIYIQAGSQEATLDMGCQNGSADAVYIASNYTGLNAAYKMNDRTLSNTSLADYLGLFGATRRIFGTKVLYHRGAVVLTSTVDRTALQSLNILIGALNANGTPAAFSTKTIAGVFIGNALSDAQHAIMETIFTGYNTILGRNV